MREDRAQNSRNNSRARVRAFPLSEYDQLADYLLFNAYSAATHTTSAAVIRDNKSAPCKRKFRGTFVFKLALVLRRNLFYLARGRCYSILRIFWQRTSLRAPVLCFLSQFSRRRYRIENLRNRNELCDDRR